MLYAVIVALLLYMIHRQAQTIKGLVLIAERVDLLEGKLAQALHELESIEEQEPSTWKES